MHNWILLFNSLKLTQRFLSPSPPQTGLCRSVAQIIINWLLKSHSQFVFPLPSSTSRRHSLATWLAQPLLPSGLASSPAPCLEHGSNTWKCNNHLGPRRQKRANRGQEVALRYYPWAAAPAQHSSSLDFLIQDENKPYLFKPYWLVFLLCEAKMTQKYLSLCSFQGLKDSWICSLPL